MGWTKFISPAKQGYLLVGFIGFGAYVATYLRLITVFLQWQLSSIKFHYGTGMSSTDLDIYKKQNLIDGVTPTIARAYQPSSKGTISSKHRIEPKVE